MALRFDEKHALVTGAGKGIGRAIALALAEAGAETFALSLTQADLDRTENEYSRKLLRNLTLYPIVTYFDMSNSHKY